MKAHVDKNNFFEGLVIDEVAEKNPNTSFYSPPPEAKLNHPYRYRMVNGSWLVEQDLTGSHWYDPKNVREAVVLKEYNETPPENYVMWNSVNRREADADEQAALIAGHTFNKATRSWGDHRTLAEVKAARRTKLEKERTAAEEGGFVFKTMTFDSKERDQAKINAAVLQAQLDPLYKKRWVLADDTTTMLNNNELINLGRALEKHLDDQLDRYLALKDAIKLAATKDEVRAVVW